MEYKEIIKNSYYHDNTGMLLHGDCLEIMQDFPDKSVNLICTDPPYNIGKADWDKIPDYIEWCGKWLLECQRVLTDNGSLYFFHNDMEQVVDLMLWIRENTNFVYKQFVVWNKRFDEAGNKGYLDGFIVPEGLRNYQQMAEYCLFYTFQDKTGLTTVKLDMNNFSTLRQYFKDYQEALGLTLNRINEMLGHRKAEHSFYWGSTQWDMPTKETYNELAKLPINNEFVCREYEDLRREYEDLRREYEDLRREYEDLRYTFNNQKTHHSVWNYEIAKRNGHITPKPEQLIENIVRHSSNEGDIVLDLFAGYSTTAAAAKNLGRRWICIEKEKEYCDMSIERIKETT